MSCYNRELVLRNAYRKINRAYRRTRSLQKKWREAFAMADIHMRLNNPLFSFHYYEHHQEAVSFTTDKQSGQTCFRYTNLQKATRRIIHYDRDNYLLDTSKCLLQELKNEELRPSALFVDLWDLHMDLRHSAAYDYKTYRSAIRKMIGAKAAGLQVSSKGDVLWQRERGHPRKREKEVLCVGATLEYSINDEIIYWIRDRDDRGTFLQSVLDELFE